LFFGVSHDWSDGHSFSSQYRVLTALRVVVFRKRMAMARIAQKAVAGLQLIGSSLPSWTALFQSTPNAAIATAPESDSASGKDEVQVGRAAAAMAATASSAAFPLFCVRRPQLSPAFDTWLPAPAVPPTLLGVHDSQGIRTSLPHP
jgi:hypothetical protein